MYESPIMILRNQLETQIEGEILTAVQGFGVHVDKEELLKALKYDRNQYQKGYHDALSGRQGEWITSEKPAHMATIKCSQCGTMYQRRFKAQYNFCPECGADMRGVQHE